MHRIHRLLTWPAALYIAYIYLWYEQFKLTGNQGSVDLFTILSDWLYLDGYEKPFRLTVAIAELVASFLVLLPWTRMYGAVLSFGIISGAIFFHVASPLGIDPYDDGGKLFKEAVAVWFCSVFILAFYRAELMALVQRWIGLKTPMAIA
jgi:uncharacterized membrane protein YphA (DoxX/SURF4 family)